MNPYEPYEPIVQLARETVVVYHITHNDQPFCGFALMRLPKTPRATIPRHVRDSRSVCVRPHRSPNPCSPTEFALQCSADYQAVPSLDTGCCGPESPNPPAQTGGASRVGSTWSRPSAPRYDAGR